ncbi:MAG TPA: hypothetical protein VGO67_23090 [Verrucomicrobiae bacterium]|jgi:hypothetical protein
MSLTLLDYVTNKTGTWAASNASQNNQLELSDARDAVTFQGPLSLNIAFVAQNVLSPLGGGNARNSTNELYSYDLEIPAGYTWQYQMSQSLASSQLIPAYRVIFRPSPCARKPPVQQPDLPCDFAVGNQPCMGQFFPVGCEPCGCGPVRLPPTCGPSLSVMPAPGGCTRPRFFNGMFITREDLETELRYLRVKNNLQRRADGQGVVWGLGIRRQGGAICVQPGYAIDCCGNDLTVTSIYKVDAAALLSDPAICNQITGRHQCMSLLLEYVECPEEPRPVHGEPCYGSVTACEMSRVRETVRLRLVPPRDYKPAGPIQTFLSTLSQGQTATAPQSSGSSTGVTTSSPASLPFQIQFSDSQNLNTSIEGTNPSSLPQPITITPIPNGQAVTAILPLLNLNNVVTSTPIITISMPVPGVTPVFAFTSGVIQDAAGNANNTPPSTAVNAANPTSASPGPISWQINLPNPIEGFRTHWTSQYTVTWSAPAGSSASSGTYNGTSAIALKFILENKTDEITDLNISVTTTATLSVPAPVNSSFPCLNDACCSGKPLFPVIPPWADDDPLNPGHTADPKVLVLALVYALYAGTAAQEDSASGNQSTKVQDFAKLFQTVAISLDPKAGTDATELAKVTQSVQQLLNDWCCSFLYPGPSCDGEPHGVVIGCAAITGGVIESISPWGGRRWVMHYPLVSYWGEQFGIVPPDVLASRLFSLICCLGNLPAPGTAVGYRTSSASPASGFTVGAATIRFAATSTASATPSQNLSLTAFAARTLSALAQPSVPAGTPMSDFTLAGFPAIHLVAPTLSGNATAQSASTSPASPTSANLTTLASQALSQSASASSVPPLLRDFAQSLTAQVVNNMPLSSLTPAAAIVPQLTTAGITTVGAVLAQSPQTIYANVLGKTQAAAVSNLIQKAESKVTQVAGEVADAIKSTAAARSLITTDDLSTNAAQTALARPIAKALQTSQASILASISASLST